MWVPAVGTIRRVDQMYKIAGANFLHHLFGQQQYPGWQLFPHTTPTGMLYTYTLAVETQASYRCPVQIRSRKRIASWLCDEKTSVFMLISLPTGLLRKLCYYCWQFHATATIQWPVGIQWRSSCWSDGVILRVHPELKSN